MMKSICLIACLVMPIWITAGEAVNRETFDRVWQTVRDKHWDLESTGVDWDAMREKYAPRAEAAETKAELRQVLREMLGQLGQSHFGILAPESSEAVRSLEADFPGGEGITGFGVALVEDRVFIVSVDLDYEAAKKGLGIGTEILSLDGHQMTDVVARLETAYADNKSREMYALRMLNQLFTGPVGSEKEMTVAIEDETREVTLALAKPKTETKAMLTLEGIPYLYQSEVLEGGIGYVSFNFFLMDVTRDFQADMAGPMKDTRGLIIDLRGNPGGIAIVASNMAGRLVNEKGKTLGAMKNPGGTMKFPVFPQRGAYEGPVALLVDGGSASTSEIMAQGLKDLGRVRVFGTPSAGAALPSIIEELPNGDRFQYAMADYTSVAGHKLEGNGVIPHELTPHTLSSMKRGEDAALEAARAWIEEKTTGAKRESM